MIRHLAAAASLAFLVTSDSPRPPTEREVEIVGLDYAFKLPTELPPGRTIFSFVNQGKVRHEFNIVRLAPGVSFDQFMAATTSDTTPPSVFAAMIDATIGVLFADPGKRGGGALSTNLLPGRTYAVQCILRDNPKAPRHRVLGMYSAIHVRDTKLVGSPAPRADTIVATEYAYAKYPQTLAPGTHDFAFVNSGKQRHEVILALLKRGETMQHLFEVVKGGGDPDSVIEDAFGVLHSRAGTNPDGLLRVHMLAGREYVIVCTFTDSPKSPPHMALGMIGNIRVTGAASGH